MASSSTVPVATSHGLSQADRAQLYRASPLKEAFRILCPHKGAGNEPLSGSLVEGVTLTQPGAYEALSYRWSRFDRNDPTYIQIDRNDPVESQVDRINFPIGPQLHAALVEFRLKTADRPLWIDQICIDQDDENDKTEQLGIMASIYAQATKVLVWLGTSTAQTDIAMDLFPELVDRARRAILIAEKESLVHDPEDLILRYGVLASALCLLIFMFLKGTRRSSDTAQAETSSSDFSYILLRSSILALAAYTLSSMFIDKTKRATGFVRMGSLGLDFQDILRRHGTTASTLYVLFSAEWFSRVWTIQEAALSRSGEIWCGRKSFPLDKLKTFQEGCEHDEYGCWADILDLIQSGQGGSTDPERPSRPINTHISITASLTNNPRLSSARAMNSTRFMNCSEHGDRVKSVLHFLDADLRTTIIRREKITNRDDEAANLFRVVASHEISHGRMDHLCAAGLWQQRATYVDDLTRGSRPRLSLSSWVPDWTCTIRSHSFWVYDSERLLKQNKPLFTAGGAALGTADVAFSQDERKLTLSAIVFDNVAKLAERYKDEQAPTDVTNQSEIMDKVLESIKFLRHYMDSCKELSEECEEHYGSRNIEMAWKKSLLGGIAPRFPNRFTTSTWNRITDEAVNVLYTDFEAHNVVMDRITQHKQRAASGQVTAQEQMEFVAFCTNSVRIVKAGNELVGRIAGVCRGRRFFITRKHYMGIAPDITEDIDRICVIPGCPAPFILRKPRDRKTKDGEYQLIGECYIDGVMDGEMSGAASERITLI